MSPAATEEDLAATVHQVEALDRRIVAMKADVRDFDAVKAAVDEGVTQLGQLDIVSAKAGVVGTPTTTESLPEDEWRTMIDINLTGVWHTVKATIPHLKAGGSSGSITLTSSVAGTRGYANMAHYVSAKHGIVGLTRTLAMELAPDSIRVNSVHPTQVNTDMIHNQPIYDLFTGRQSATREELAAMRPGTSPARRWRSTQEATCSDRPGRPRIDGVGRSPSANSRTAGSPTCST